MIGYVEYLNMPTKVAIYIIAAFFIIQIIGELLEFKGKVVPECLKVRKYFIRKKAEKAETITMMKEVKQLLGDVNEHYSADNIAKRDSWMQWVNDRAQVYDSSIIDINKSLSEVVEALKDNTKLTEEMFIQDSRDRVINFAAKASDLKIPVSREEYNRVFKVYDKYEKYLEEHCMPNGEVDIAYHIITDSYEERIRTHSFIEDGYKTAD